MNKIMRKQLIILLFLGLTVLSSIASAIDDVKSLSGATDYPGLPRIKDSILIGKNQFAYDIGTFINEIKARKWKTTKAQGARTQLVYFAPSELSLAAVINNYRSAFQQLGDVEELFHCDKNSCLRDIGKKFIGKEYASMAFSHDKVFSMYSSSYYTQQSYLSVKISNKEDTLFVSVYSALPNSFSAKQMKLSEVLPVIHIDLVQVGKFSSSLELIESPEIDQPESKVHGVKELADTGDYKSLPRIKNSVLIGKSSFDFDAGEFIESAKKKNWSTLSVSGKRTQLVYFAPPNHSPVGAVNNYRSVFEDLGEFEEIFYCHKDGCPEKIGQKFIYPEYKQVKLSHQKAFHLYNVASYYDTQAYLSAKVKNAQGEFIVSAYSTLPIPNIATSKAFMDLREPLPIVHVEIVQVADFSADLEVVEASEINRDIDEKGHISLYGLYFDSGSAVLKAESKESLVEITKALNNAPDLSVFVVGHTDSDGTFENNNTLSKNRAQAVVNALTGQHGIASGRLQAVGVGQVAPVASNDTEAGKALNRRVELVKK